MFYVYEWYDCETQQVIYVGKGHKRRYKVRKHNKFFNHYIATHKCKSRIVKEFDNEKDAFYYEFERVNELKATGQCFCNIYEGGRGGTVECWTPERRQEYSDKNVMKSNAQRQRMSLNNPMKNPKTVDIVASQLKRPIILGGVEYGSAKEIAKIYNVSLSSVYNWANKGYSSDGKSCYYQDEGEHSNWYKKYKNSHVTNTRMVAVDNNVFETVKSAAEFLKCDPSALIRKIKSNQPYRGHICKYVNQQPSQANPDNSSLEGSTTNG